MAKGTSAEGRPEKLFYRIGEVCEITDTQPYVLRFWESEFPQLAPQKTQSGQRIYRASDVELILRIKKLLYEEEFTIAGARRHLEQEAITRGLPVQGPAVEEPESRALLDEIRQELGRLRSLLEEPVPGLSADPAGEEEGPGNRD
ncbi:MAG: MerR family transcriptional regulator [Acidobacteria bacterium]|nr:MerR family transcriptional regulator [Acidobacteriota bacterium]